MANMTKLVTIAPNRQLATTAGASYDRMRTDGLPAGGINSAYRSIASQDAIFRARYKIVYRFTRIWYAGHFWVHVSGLPVAVPGKSAHNKGLALDVALNSKAHDWLIKHGARYGWSRPIPDADPVHWEYNAKNDDEARAQAAARKQIRYVQKALHVAHSGQFDAATRKAARAVESANDTPATFPYGVEYAQTHSGTKADNHWGVKSKAANTKTVKAVQSALGQTPDGDWGAKTQADLEATARRAK